MTNDCRRRGQKNENPLVPRLCLVTHIQRLCLALFPSFSPSLVPRLCLVTHIQRLCLAPSNKSSDSKINQINWQQSILTHIISITRISPTSRIVNIAAPNRIIVDILQFLQQHCLIQNSLRVEPSLPSLKFLVFFAELSLV